MSGAAKYSAEQIAPYVGQRIRLTFRPGCTESGRLVASRYRELDIERRGGIPFHIESYLDSISLVEVMGTNGRYQEVAV